MAATLDYNQKVSKFWSEYVDLINKEKMFISTRDKTLRKVG